jgi:NADPH:quinone reductase-like Zn-dependent oxidoreductase
MLVDTSHSHLDEIVGLVERGSLAATIAQVFPLDQVAEAHRAGETGRTTGKLVLRMD